MLLILASLAAALGHGLFGCALWGRVTAENLPCRFIRVFEKLWVAVVLLYPCWLAYNLFAVYLGQAAAWTVSQSHALDAVLRWYGFAAAGFAAITVPARIARNAASHAEQGVSRRRVLDAAERLPRPWYGTRRAAMWGRFPGNEVLQIELNEKTLTCSRMAPELDGLTIAHLSDLHFTGRIRREFFELAAEETTALGADLIAITGDVLDRAVCSDWFYPVFDRLRAPLGVYCILGNHDKQFGNVEIVRKHLVDCGVTTLGGRWVEVSMRGQRVLLAGNELPWLPAAEVSLAPEPAEHGLRLLLSHSPDQINWARRHAFDVMLAGHTHGGQIRLPLLGALLAPSRYGTRYACGTFNEPPTVMHVTRGLSALHCLRLRCRPEISKLTLRSA